MINLIIERKFNMYNRLFVFSYIQYHSPNTKFDYLALDKKIHSTIEMGFGHSTLGKELFNKIEYNIKN